MRSIELIKQAIDTKGKASLSHRNFNKLKFRFRLWRDRIGTKFRCDPAKGGPKGDRARAKRVPIWHFSGMSMYPTLKDSMMLDISNIPAAAIKTSDIIAYKQDNKIVAHRVIDVIRDNGRLMFVTKGDNQPFGGISQIEQKDLIGRVERAFYAGQPQENVLTKNQYYGLLYLLLGRTYLFYRKFIRKYLPEALRISLKNSISGLYFILKRFSFAMENL